jgi:hypothetical protein
MMAIHNEICSECISIYNNINGVILALCDSYIVEREQSKLKTISIITLAP